MFIMAPLGAAVAITSQEYVRFTEPERMQRIKVPHERFHRGGQTLRVVVLVVFVL